MPIDLPEATPVIITLRPIGSAGPAPTDPLLGLMADEPELIDQVVEMAMTSRESHPLRTDD
jgi:hypothetical protein